MVVIINGSLAVGKTSVAWALADIMQNSVMLDGDYIGAIFPGDFHDSKWLDYLYKTFATLIKFHKENGYDNFVINYVFETPASLNQLIKHLSPIDTKNKSFLLVCSEDVQRQRILARNNNQLEWELKRYVELNNILKDATSNGYIGREIDTSNHTAMQIAENIFNSL